MTTYLQLQGKVAEAIGDPEYATFPVETVKAMIDAGWAEISNIAPERFQEDIAPVLNANSYQLRITEFGGVAVDTLEIQRVEIWDTSSGRPRAWRQIEPQSAHPLGLTYSQAGWFEWGGFLTLPDRAVDMINLTTHVIRVWGYSPWPPVSADTDIVPFGAEREQALIVYCNVEALRRLTSNRTLFTQWQTRSNNTDVSMASLMSDLNVAQQDWVRRARRIQVIREKS